MCAVNFVQEPCYCSKDKCLKERTVLDKFLHLEN